MSTVLAVDPGKNILSAAYFRDGALAEATCIRGEGPLYCVALMNNWLVFDVDAPSSFDTLIVESQQIYRHSKGDPNDLLPLAFQAGAVMHAVCAAEKLSPLPRAWKGTVKKEIMTARILSKLSPAERTVIDTVKCPKSLLHNVVDAAGIGLWHLGRL